MNQSYFAKFAYACELSFGYLSNLSDFEHVLLTCRAVCHQLRAKVVKYFLRSDQMESAGWALNRCKLWQAAINTKDAAFDYEQLKKIMLE